MIKKTNRSTDEGTELKISMENVVILSKISISVKPGVMKLAPMSFRSWEMFSFKKIETIVDFLLGKQFSALPASARN